MYWHRWNWETITQKSMLLWLMNTEPAVFHTALFAGGLRDSELEKSALKMVTVQVVQFRSRTSKPSFCEVTYWRKSTYNYLWNMWLDVMFQLAQLKELCMVILTWKKKIKARWLPHVLTDQQKEESWIFKGLAENVWTWWTQTPLWRNHRWWNQAILFMASLRNGPIRCGWLLMERDQLCFN